MANHMEAYGRVSVRPKFHWMFDVAEQLREEAVRAEEQG
jgi:hypothetical protein